ncbi:MAG: hypothetical protein R3E87_10290 [Burkholderiaceae bacterium]
MSASSGITRLRFEARQTVFDDQAASTWRVAVGIEDLVDHVFKHDPPTAVEIERAIDVVEDALSATALRQAARGDLSTDDPVLHALLGMHSDGERRDRDEVEGLFGRFAAASQARSVASLGSPFDRKAAAVLLILRECMHHLGFEGVRRSGV